MWAVNVWANFLGRTRARGQFRNDLCELSVITGGGERNGN